MITTITLKRMKLNKMLDICETIKVNFHPKVAIKVVEWFSCAAVPIILFYYHPTLLDKAQPTLESIVVNSILSGISLGRNEMAS